MRDQHTHINKMVAFFYKVWSAVCSLCFTQTNYVGTSILSKMKLPLIFRLKKQTTKLKPNGENVNVLSLYVYPQITFSSHCIYIIYKWGLQTHRKNCPDINSNWQKNIRTEIEIELQI